MNCYRNHSSFIVHRSSLSRTGFTILEVLIAGIIAAMMVTMALALFTHALRIEKGDRSQLLIVDNARRGLERIRQQIISANTITIKESGNLLEIEDLSSTSTTKAIFYQDDDNNPLTIHNNYMVFDPDTSVADDESAFIKYVSARDGQPIFSDPGSESPAIVIKFHVGDTEQNMEYANPYTGIGYQGLDIETVVTPRNTHVD